MPRTYAISGVSGSSFRKTAHAGRKRAITSAGAARRPKRCLVMEAEYPAGRGDVHLGFAAPRGGRGGPLRKGRGASRFVVHVAATAVRGRAERRCTRPAPRGAPYARVPPPRRRSLLRRLAA